MEFIVHEDQCTGCQACIAVAGEVLEMNEAGSLPQLQNGVDVDAQADKLEEAVAVCPFAAIELK